jgi:Icc protein
LAEQMDGCAWAFLFFHYNPLHPGGPSSDVQSLNDADHVPSRALLKTHAGRFPHPATVAAQCCCRDRK